MEKLKIYIIHYTPLIERKTFQLKQLSNLSLLNYLFIEKYDKDNLIQRDLIKFDKKKLKLNLNRQSSELNCISLIKKHIYAIKLIQNSNFYYNLILEDDAILDKDFVLKLTRGLKQLPDDYDILFLGDGCNLHIPSKILQPNKFIYKKCREATSWGGEGGTRCTDSMLISKTCAIKIYNYYKSISGEVVDASSNSYISNNYNDYQRHNKIDLPMDWWLNNIIRHLKLNIYWMEPTIVTQGSTNGKFLSSIAK